MKTLHGDKELLIEAKERKRGGGSWFDRNEKDEKDVRRYVFLINNGEARVQVRFELCFLCEYASYFQLFL